LAANQDSEMTLARWAALVYAIAISRSQVSCIRVLIPYYCRFVSKEPQLVPSPLPREDAKGIQYRRSIY